jgi:hypothetical protein
VMGCDVCGRIGETCTLNERLRTKELRDICEPCRKKVDKLLCRYREYAWKRVRRKLAALRKEALWHLPATN